MHRNIKWLIVIMNASEIRYIEARLPVAYDILPGPAAMEHYMAQIRRERNAHIAATFASGVRKLAGFVREVRTIAVACTAARLHQTAA